MDKLSDLSPHPKNPRKISDEQLERLKKSIGKFGDLSGIVYNRKTGHVVGGHQRIKVLPENASIFKTALKKKAPSGTVAVGYVEIAGERFVYREVDWDKNTEKAAMIAANQHGGEWELKLLGESLTELEELEWDMDLLGFDERELVSVTGHMRSKKGLIEDDEIPEKAPARAKRGQIWQLGQHRLMCGDSTAKEDVDRLMAGEKADMVFTDPPYGLGDKWSGGTWATNPMYADAKKWDQPLKQIDIDRFITLAPIIIIWGANYYRMPPSRCWLSWTKSQKMETMADFELAWTNFDEVAKSWTGARNQDGKREHPTQKPVELMEWGMSIHADPKTVLDLFGGSGSTLIACEKTDRRCFMMEIDPHYCDVIVARWEAFTGKKAKLVSGIKTGRKQANA